MNFIRCCILLSLTLSSNNMFAQRQNSDAVKTPHFIEGIVISRNGNSYSVKTVSDEKPKVEEVKNDKSDYAISVTEQVNSLQIRYAQLLDVEIEKTSNKKLFEFIDDWMDTRYRFGGSSKSGIDCSGFSSMLFKEVYGKKLPRMASEQYRSCKKIEKEEMTEGDLVFFNTRGGVSHVGVYLSNDFFIHSSTREGVIISSLNEEYYHKRFIGAGRITEQEQDKIVNED